jgi:alpha-tubulin suppressor-like RCC1 family protein
MITFTKSWPYGYESSFNAVPGQFQQVAAGTAHTVALSSGKLFVCGLGRSGRLGIPGTDQIDLNYYTVSGFKCFLPNDNFTKIHCGYESTFALSSNGVWFACGEQLTDSLGLTSSKYPWPMSVKSFQPMPNGYNNWSSLAAGQYHLLGLSGNKIYSCGLNGEGATGHFESDNTAFPPFRITFWKPLTGSWTRLGEIAPSSRHTVALSANNKWFGCGDNTHGCLGFGTQDLGPVFGMRPIPGNWLRMVCGLSRTFALSTNGQWFVAGRNQSGQLGLGDIFTRYSFTPLPGNWKDIVCGDLHTFALSSSNVWLGCGSNYQGQLGLTTIPVPSNFWTITSFAVVMNSVDYVKKVVTGGTGTSFAMIEASDFTVPYINTFVGNNILTFNGLNILLL